MSGELTAQAAEVFPDEVVTSAPVRVVDLPGGAGRLALITLDNGFDHTKPTTFGPRGLQNIGAALDRIAGLAESGEIVAAGVTGKPFIFAVGADLKGVEAVTGREQAYAIGKQGHDVFRRLGELPVPTFAFVNGAAMGGGVEIALHCTYRTISAGVPALSLPEVFLGLIPGWGGTQLLPRLIGPDKAVTVVVENPLSQNRQLKGPKAYEFGIADAMFAPVEFLEESLAWASRVLRGEVVIERKTFADEEWDAALARGRQLADSRLHGATPAPYLALDLIAKARTASRDEGFAAEDEALADRIMSEELRSGIYAFNLVQKRAKRPVGAPDKALARPVTKVGIVGAGLMASQLALLFVQQLTVPVVLTDIDQERVDKGVKYVHEQLDLQALKGKLNGDKLNRLKGLVSGSLTKDAFADADFVIEAVFEQLSVKQAVFAEVEAVVRPDCVLATNTSSLSVTEMAAGLAHPERVVGFHFFNPVAVLPLLEIVRAGQTDDATLATAFAVAKALKKSSVLVKDAPAFVVNRLLTRFLGVVNEVLDEGTPVDVADGALDPLGLPMPPLVLMELVGPAVALHVSETLHAAFPDRFSVSENVKRLVAAGKRAFYLPGTTDLDPDVVVLLEVGDKLSTAEEVRDRAAAAIAEEIDLMLRDGVVAEAQDIDLCMILGAGWPFHLGGITPYLDRTGVSEKVAGHRFVPVGLASLPA
ncbi:MAG TPA: 3-hydroxyacyl-CoA dehydrogenase NAD-binding domain-containing protein [Actinocrinis sp.]|uniref:3-hydroxyacyl-CoA dehydrogenase NAD-binding domain-containing protein n=1 Tax=Actinocrinis sp. TaxID=1920516 RepID=UPI002DDDA8B6|nr:3-hydroxyacyl-CoA dehydrogenase NAD-binding domain-containing protein [Actinocrinis sp.]HEV2342841.1 3-hydroxyacyl-CoA dehydrogenase NAD-binding domain-containing protein [Actinocrinis sp.]